MAGGNLCDSKGCLHAETFAWNIMRPVTSSPLSVGDECGRSRRIIND